METKNNISNMSIFGDYKQFENRVTAALLHILKYGGDSLMERFVALPDRGILVETQIKQGDLVWDGRISCGYSFNVHVESKVVCNAINKAQLDKQLCENKSVMGSLIYITPDSVRPKILPDEVSWFNWEQIVVVLNQAMTEDFSNELLRFLVEQFQVLIESHGGLIDRLVDQRVVVVGGSYGEEVALKYGFYACQNNRYFQKSRYLAFAFNNRIKYLFEIISVENGADLSCRNDVGSYITDREPQYKGKRTLFVLNKIREFNPPIENDSVDYKGTRCAYTMKQVYTSFDKIMTARKTSDLM